MANSITTGWFLWPSQVSVTSLGVVSSEDSVMAGAGLAPADEQPASARADTTRQSGRSIYRRQKRIPLHTTETGPVPLSVRYAPNLW